MMSGRLPLGRFLNVGGNSDTRLSHTVPGLRVATTNRFVVDGVSCPVFSVALYFFHSVVIRGTSADAHRDAPSLVSIETVNGPRNAALPFAQNDTRYVVSGLAGMPQ